MKKSFANEEIVVINLYLASTQSVHLSQYFQKKPNSIENRSKVSYSRAYLYIVRDFPENIQEYPLDAHGVRV